MHATVRPSARRCAAARRGSATAAPCPPLLRCSPRARAPPPCRAAGEAGPDAAASPPGEPAAAAAAAAAAAEATGVLDRDNPDLRERFAVVGSGSAECKGCQYVYAPRDGDPAYPVAPGTLFENLPSDWRCPVCGAEKRLFVSRAKVVAGFSQNQGYGLGGNAMTAEQKSLLIYGTLLTFFALFLAGYLLD